MLRGPGEPSGSRFYIFRGHILGGTIWCTRVGEIIFIAIRFSKPARITELTVDSYISLLRKTTHLFTAQQISKRVCIDFSKAMIPQFYKIKTLPTSSRSLCVRNTRPTETILENDRLHHALPSRVSPPVQCEVAVFFFRHTYTPYLHECLCAKIIYIFYQHNNHQHFKWDYNACCTYYHIDEQI